MRDTRLVATLAGLALVLGLGSLCIGHVFYSPAEVLRALLAGDGTKEGVIVTQIRLPRAILGALIGAGLGAAGAGLQGLLRNPLAEPGVIGVSGGATLGAVIALYYGLSGVFALALPLAALAGAALATVVLLILALRRAGTLSLVLAGVAISSFTMAATSLAMNMSPNPYALTELVFWLLGSLKDRSITDVWIAGPFILCGIALIASQARALDALTLGEETAESMGVSIIRLSVFVVIGTAAAVGAGVAVAGAVGFVGLVAPHLMRPLAGHAPGRLVVPATLAGAVLVLAADLAVRLVPAGTELKLGVVTSLVGAPFLLRLILQTEKRGG